MYLLFVFDILYRQVRIWAPPSQLAQGVYALDIAAKTLSNYEKFFKIKFPLPKQGKNLTLTFDWK